MHDILRYAREYAINLYLNRNSKIDIDKSIYHKYILDCRFIMPEETRKILTMFMIENKSYDEISSLTGFSNYTISNRITEMIRKMDNYRFNLLHFENHTEETLNKFYRECGLAFSEIEKQMLESKYLVGLENPDILKKYGISKDEINRLIARFNKSYFSYQIRNVKLTKEEIEEDVNKPVIESVTSEREKQYISYYYGIKNKYNPVGEKLTNAEIYKKFGINKNIFHHAFELGISKIKGRKIGISRPDLLYIEKDELIELLKDSHLPISKKEREIINYLFGLNGYQKKTIDGLSEIYGETQGSIKRRYMRSIVSICKYKNNEIEGKIEYDIDICPKLKYFPNNYRKLIEEYYKDGLTYEKIAKKYYITVDQVISIFDRIKEELFDVINNPKKQRFDFDFYEKNKDNPNLPFYGDACLADKIFRLHFGMDDIKKLSASEIKEKLNLKYAVSWINKTILDYMLAICKLKDGITKSRQFTYDEVMEHYLKFEKTMVPMVKASYKRYFDRMDNNKYTYVKRPNINEVIICDILKEKYKYYIDVSSLSREQVINLLKKYYKDIDSSIRNELMYLFNITEKEFMSGKEHNHLYRILNELDNKLSIEKDNSYKKQKKRK